MSTANGITPGANSTVTKGDPNTTIQSTNRGSTSRTSRRRWSCKGTDVERFFNKAYSVGSVTLNVAAAPFVIGGNVTLNLSQRGLSRCAGTTAALQDTQSEAEYDPEDRSRSPSSLSRALELARRLKYGLHRRKDAITPYIYASSDQANTKTDKTGTSTPAPSSTPSSLPGTHSDISVVVPSANWTESWAAAWDPAQSSLQSKIASAVMEESILRRSETPKPPAQRLKIVGSNRTSTNNEPTVLSVAITEPTNRSFKDSVGSFFGNLAGTASYYIWAAGNCINQELKAETLRWATASGWYSTPVSTNAQTTGASVATGTGATGVGGLSSGLSGSNYGSAASSAMGRLSGLAGGSGVSVLPHRVSVV